MKDSGRIIDWAIANQDAPKNNVSKTDHIDGPLGLTVCEVPNSSFFCLWLSHAPGMGSTDSPENLKAS